MGVKLSGLKLAEAFRHKSGQSLAFTGAGGKTTAIFNLARELKPPVLVTTTTHLGINQLQLADQVIRLDSSTYVEELISNLDSKVTLLVGDQAENQRISGPPSNILEDIFSNAHRRDISLLIEADGSRLKPVKAPAAYEPNIPPFVQGVVVVAGLSAIGKPLTAEWVHREEVFSEISGLRFGEEISPEAILKLLMDPRGGLKNIPPDIGRYCLLNQADTSHLLSIANRIASSLTSVYDACAVSSFLDPATEIMVKEGLDKSDRPSRDMIHAVQESVYGVILAAGGSNRMGEAKQILKWHQEPMIRQITRTAISANLAGVIVVIGASGNLVKEALLNLQVEIVNNPDWHLGQSSSLIAGLNYLPKRAGAVIFLLADQPLVPESLIRALIEKRALTLSPIVMPIIDGQRGNPVLFGWQTFDELRSIRGDKGGRAIFHKFPIERIEWLDPSVLLEVDTPEDYQRLLSLDD